VGPACRRYRSIAARRRSAAAGCECGQCHVVGVRRKLNTDSVLYYCLNFAALRYSQDDVEDDGELNAAVDDADLPRLPSPPQGIAAP